MNPFQSFSQLLFTCVDGPIFQVVDTVLRGFNKPNEYSARHAHGEVIIQYFLREVSFDISLAYVDKSENCSTPQRIIFWQPVHHVNKTVFMCNRSDGMTYSLSQLYEHSLFAWTNVRIYEDPDYPACSLG